MSALDFNPREVLDHLHELGYTNITADQLKEFIKDLKKLIKYDQRMKDSRRKAEGNQKGIFEDDSEDDEEEESNNKLRVPNTTKPRRVVSPLTAELASENMRRRNNHNSQLDKDEMIANSGGTSGSCTSSDVDIKQKVLKPNHSKPEHQTKPCEELKPDQRRRHDSECRAEQQKCNPTTAYTKRPCSAKENVEPTRSRSFIRPWKYPSVGQKSGHLSNRCDPVTLYHKYQALWQQNKIPGEENHSGLRWNIRERMLGQDPHPRPVSQASSLESVNRRSVSRM